MTMGMITTTTIMRMTIMAIAMTLATMAITMRMAMGTIIITMATHSNKSNCAYDANTKDDNGSGNDNKDKDIRKQQWAKALITTIVSTAITGSVAESESVPAMRHTHSEAVIIRGPTLNHYRHTHLRGYKSETIGHTYLRGYTSKVESVHDEADRLRIKNAAIRILYELVQVQRHFRDRR